MGKTTDKKPFDYSDYKDIPRLPMKRSTLTKKLLKKAVIEIDMLIVFIILAAFFIFMGIFMLTKRPEGFYIIIPIVFLTLGAASLINLICDLINKYKTIKSIGSNEFVLIEASVKDIYAEDDHEDGPNGPGEGYNSYTTLKYLYNENAKNVKIKISNMAEWKVLKNQQIHLAFCTAKGEITLEPFMLILGNSYIIDPEIKVLYQKNIISP